MHQVYKEGVDFLEFPSFHENDKVKHLCSTRMGGVSKGMFSTMNLSFTRGDDTADVMENYRKIAGILECDLEDIVCTDQTHTSNIRVVTREDGGKGVVRDKDYTDVDALITNCPGVVLACFVADCVPILLLDKVKGVIAVAHSGWRGTVEQIGSKTVEKMKLEFDSKVEDIIVGIGPSICCDCYEVSEDVANIFQNTYTESEQKKIIYTGKVAGKYQLDLWEANKINLLNVGILSENITVTDICTCCNSNTLFSHRASQGKRGNLGAFLMLT